MGNRYRSMVILGFDPGGKNQFGWCVAQGTPDWSSTFVRFARLECHADEAVRAALRRAAASRRVEAAGIDSPYSSAVADADRKADRVVPRQCHEATWGEECRWNCTTREFFAWGMLELKA